MDASITTLAPARGGRRLQGVAQRCGQPRGASRLTSTEAAKPSTVDSSRPPGKLAPALLIRMSSVENDAASSAACAVGHTELPVGHSAQVDVVVVRPWLGAGDRHLGAAIAEQCRGRMADTAGAAGHQRRCSVKSGIDPIGHDSSSICLRSHADSQKLVLCLRSCSCAGQHRLGVPVVRLNTIHDLGKMDGP